MPTCFSLAVVLIALFAPLAHAQYRELQDFSLAQVYGGVVLDSSGNIYGAIAGDENDQGEIFQIVMPGDTLNLLHTFNGPPDGAEPYGPLVFDHAGNLYGTTSVGGAHNAGTVFMMSPSSGGQWRERVLYSFTGAADGGNPQSGAFLDNSGHLYGTTTTGGAYGQGTVYRLTLIAVPQETTLHSFGGSGDGVQPTGSLVEDASGNLYGTTYSGGAYGLGTAYEVSPAGSSWTEMVLHSFPGEANDGENPSGGLVFNSSGYLIGAAEHGGMAFLQCQTGECGVLFRLVLQPGFGWVEQPFVQFWQYPGSNPVGPVTLTTTSVIPGVYVPTLSGGANETGAVTQELPYQYGTWIYVTLANFPDDLYLQSNGGLAQDRQGNLYGTYNSDNHSAVYEVTP
jgi:uncharacterized repeat protein (TIGR03803 family)